MSSHHLEVKGFAHEVHSEAGQVISTSDLTILVKIPVEK